MGCADRFLNVRNDAGKSNANIPGGGSCGKSKMLITYLTQDAKSFAFPEQIMFIHLIHIVIRTKQRAHHFGSILKLFFPLERHPTSLEKNQLTHLVITQMNMAYYHGLACQKFQRDFPVEFCDTLKM